MRKIGMGVEQHGADLAAENAKLKKENADLAAENAKLIKALKKSGKKGKAGADDQEGTAAEGTEEQKPSESDTSVEK